MKRSTDISDTIRIHPIITKGGNAVSVVPAEVHVEPSPDTTDLLVIARDMQRAGASPRSRPYRLVRRAQPDGAASLARDGCGVSGARCGPGLRRQHPSLVPSALHYLHLLVGDQRSKALKIGNVKVSRRCTS